MDKNRFDHVTTSVPISRNIEAVSQPAESREVWQEIDQLEDLVKSVTDAVINLRGRVEPVLSPMATVDANDIGAIKERQIAPMADRIRQIRYMLASAHGALSDIHERLEI